MTLPPNHRLNAGELRSVIAAIDLSLAKLNHTSASALELMQARLKLVTQLDLLK